MSLAFTDAEYITIATNLIRNYKKFPDSMNMTDSDIQTTYELVIQLIIQNIKDSLTIDKSVAQMVEGHRHVVFKDNVIILDNCIKGLLGNPYVRFM